MPATQPVLVTTGFSYCVVLGSSPLIFDLPLSRLESIPGSAFQVDQKVLKPPASELCRPIGSDAGTLYANGGTAMRLAPNKPSDDLPRGEISFGMNYRSCAQFYKPLTPPGHAPGARRGHFNMNRSSKFTDYPALDFLIPLLCSHWRVHCSARAYSPARRK